VQREVAGACICPAAYRQVIDWFAAVLSGSPPDSGLHP